MKLNGQIMEEVNEFKYLCSILCKCGSIEGEVQEEALQGRKVVGSLGCMMKSRTVNMEIKKSLCHNIILPTVMYVSKTWTWNEGQRSRIQTIEMSYLRGSFGLNRIDGESSESVYGKLGMSFKNEGMNCGVVEVVKCNTLRWFGHLERMGGDKLTKRIYKSGVDAVGVRRRPPVKLEDRVLEYWRERGGRRLRGMVNARVECRDWSK